MLESKCARQVGGGKRGMGDELVVGWKGKGGV